MGVTQGKYGTSGAMTFIDTIMSPPYGSSPFHSFPTQDIGEDPGTGYLIYDDFVTLNNVATNGLWLVTKGTGGAITLSSTAGTTSGGWVRIPTAASASDYQTFATQKAVMGMGVNVDMAFEVSINVTEAATNASSWYAGFTSTLTAGFLASGVPPSTYSGVVFYKTTGGLLVKCQTSNATTQVTSGTLATAVTATTLILGAYINHNDNVTAIVTPYVSTVAANVRTSVAVGPTLNWTIASLANMFFSFGIAAGSGGTAETLCVDYAQAVQGRFYQ